MLEIWDGLSSVSGDCLVEGLWEGRLRAFIRSEYGSTDVLRLEEVPMPTPQSVEILVKVRAASVNMADVDYLTGRPKVARLGTGLQRPKNTGLGLDLAGLVVAVGDQVSD